MIESASRPARREARSVGPAALAGRVESAGIVESAGLGAALALVLGLLSCTPSPGGPASLPGGEAGWLGSFVTPEQSHPILVPASKGLQQSYFRPASVEEGEWIAIVPRALGNRIRLGEPVRVRGVLAEVDLGGPPGSRRAYRGKKLRVIAIEALDTPD